jgi:hypothetical protein
VTAYTMLHAYLQRRFFALKGTYSHSLLKANPMGGKVNQVILYAGDPYSFGS